MDGMSTNATVKPAANGNVPGNLAASFQKLKGKIHRQIVEMLDISKLSRWKQERLRREVRQLASRLMAKSPEMLNEVERERLIDEVMDEMFGLGPLEPLMNDPTVSDILVNGPQTVYVERYGRLELTDVVFADDAHLMQIIQRIAVAGRPARRRDRRRWSTPGLPDGSRVNAIIPPLSLEGPVLSIRRFGVRLDRRGPARQRHDAAGDARAARRRRSRRASAS